MFMVSASARPESAGVVAARLRTALRAFAASPPQGAALARARKRAVQSWPLTLESHGQLLASWLAGDAAGMPATHLSAMPEALGAATGAAAANGLRDGVTLLIAGPALRMQGRLSALGRVDNVERHMKRCYQQASLRGGVASLRQRCRRRWTGEGR